MASEAGNKILRSILRDQEDCEFDLAGYTEAQTEALMTETFKAGALDSLPNPIRVSFIVGGGKLVRTRYGGPAGLGIVAGKALRGVGYTENSGAAAGDVNCYKHQHDTGMNLMRLHVFCGPKKAEGSGAQAAASGGAGAEEAPAGVVNRNGIVYTSAACDMERFPKLVAAKVVSYTQKKRLKDILEQLMALLKGVDAKLVEMKPLTQEEKEWYEILTAEGLEEKLKWLGDEMKKMVSEGKLTAPEKTQVLAQATARLAEAEKEVAKAKEAGSGVSAARLAAMQTGLDGLKARVEAISKAPAFEGHPVRNAPEIKKLAAKRAAYMVMKAKGKMLSLSEVKELAALEEAHEQLCELEEAAKGWFETDEEFQARLAPLLKAGAKGVTNRK